MVLSSIYKEAYQSLITDGLIFWSDDLISHLACHFNHHELKCILELNSCPLNNLNDILTSGAFSKFHP